MAEDISTQDVRKLRAKQPWVRYDSVVIGPGARQAGGAGWFDNWQDFANAEEITFNDGTRTKNVGIEYCNSSGDTEDWGQKILETRVEFFSPPGIFGFEENALDGGVFQALFGEEFPRRMHATVELADTDTYLQVPPVMLPSNLGVGDGSLVPGFGAIGVTVGGHTGQADFRTGWAWPKGLDVPAKSKIAVRMRIGKPLREVLQQLSNAPAQKNIPTIINGILTNVQYRNWYVIRVSHWGPRYLQLRGATSA